MTVTLEFVAGKLTVPLSQPTGSREDPHLLYNKLFMNIKNGLVSIVINCYNGSLFVRQAVESVLSQTYSNWEIIFWDNQSTDDSASIVKSYKDSRIRYIQAKTHTTLGAARRLAVKECDGDYISFLDTDDIYYPDNLERKIEFLEREGADVVYGGVVYIRKDGTEISRRLPRYKSGNLFESFLYQFDVEVASMMIRNRALKEDDLNFDEGIYGSEEYDLLLRLSVRRRFAIVNQSISKVRIHTLSLTNAVMEKWAMDRRLTLKKIIDSDPRLKNQFKNAFKEAFARADYYESRWLIYKGQISDAQEIMKKVVLVNWRYFFLYAILKISPPLWIFLHNYLPSSRNKR